jgi:hypothetical protein
MNAATMTRKPAKMAKLAASPVARAARQATEFNPDTWKKQVVADAKHIISLLLAAEEASQPDEDANERHLLAIAEGALHAWLTVVEQETATSEAANAWLHWLDTSIIPLIEGAAALQEGSNEPMAAVVRMTAQAARDLALALDAGGPLPKIDRGSYGQQQFMRGKALLADLLDQVWATEADNDIEAKHRPCGVMQNTSAADACLNQLRFDYGAQRGFAAALTGSISIGASFGLPDSDMVRDFTYEECIGGPNTVYSNEEERGTDPAASATSPTGIAAWRVTVQVAVGKIKDLFSALEEVDHTKGDGNPVAADLARIADRLLDENEELLRTSSADDYYGTCFRFVQAQLVGAKSLPNLSGSVDAIVTAAHDKAQEVVSFLDTADSEPRPVADVAATLAQIDSVRDGAKGAGEVAPDFAPTSPDEERLDEIISRLSVYIEGLEHVSIADQAHQILHAQVWGPFYEAEEQLHQHKPALASQTLRNLRSGLVSMRETMGVRDGGWPAVHQSILLIDKVLDDQPEPDLPSSERLSIAQSATTFIARLVSYFQAATHPGTMGDLDALGQSASVILSALTDPVEDAHSLRERLERALESASVILQDQPPAYWKTPGILRERDVGKRLAAAH